MIKRYRAPGNLTVNEMDCGGRVIEITDGDGRVLGAIYAAIQRRRALDMASAFARGYAKGWADAYNPCAPPEYDCMPGAVEIKPDSLRIIKE